MKNITIILLMFLSHALIAQENDSSRCKYGLTFDYSNAVVNSVGFKYIHNDDMAYFFRFSGSKEETILRMTGNDRSDGVDTYKGSVGIEYTVFRNENIFLLTILGGGMTATTYSQPYFTSQNVFTGNHDLKISTYSIEAGLGAEYYFSPHLSLGGSQSITLDYTRDNLFSQNQIPATKITTKVNIVYAKVTLAFYF